MCDDFATGANTGRLARSCTIQRPPVAATHAPDKHIPSVVELDSRNVAARCDPHRPMPCGSAIPSSRRCPSVNPVRGELECPHSCFVRRGDLRHRGGTGRCRTRPTRRRAASIRETEHEAVGNCNSAWRPTRIARRLQTTNSDAVTDVPAFESSSGQAFDAAEGGMWAYADGPSLTPNSSSDGQSCRWRVRPIAGTGLQPVEHVLGWILFRSRARTG